MSSPPDQFVIDKICEGIAAGMSQRESCALANVDESTFRLWKRKYPEVNTQYTHAREERSNGWAEGMIEIVDSVDLAGDPFTVKNRIAHLHERLDARKWVISRINKDYREKVGVEHTMDDTFTDRLKEARENAHRARQS